MAMTSEHSPHRLADTTNTLALGAVDDVHPTPSVVDGSNARPPHCPDGWSSSPSLIAPTLKTLSRLPDSLPLRSEMAFRQPHPAVVALALGGAHHPRYTVAHSKQKSSSRSPAFINIDMLRTSHQKKPVMPYIAICYNRVLYITISALCCTKCNNSIMASKAYPPYL